jgi:hypothetical protein
MRRKFLNGDGDGVLDALARSRRNFVLAVIIFPAAGLVGFTGSMSLRSMLSHDTHQAAPPSPSSEDDADDAAPATAELPDSARRTRDKRLLAHAARTSVGVHSAVPPA